MIYFIRQGVDGPIKIGFSGTVRGARGRLDAMQTAHAVELRMLAVYPGTREDEKTLHGWFNVKRLRGEWFDPCPGLLSVVESREQFDDLLDFSEAYARWQKQGILDRDRVLTDDGQAYLRVLERAALLGQRLDIEALI